jgi:hypothetical protein
MLSLSLSLPPSLSLSLCLSAIVAHAIHRSIGRSFRLTPSEDAIAHLYSFVSFFASVICHESPFRRGPRFLRSFTVESGPRIRRTLPPLANVKPRRNQPRPTNGYNLVFFLLPCWPSGLIDFHLFDDFCFSTRWLFRTMVGETLPT